MGIEISQFVAVGYQISSKQIDAALAKVIPAEYKYEDRFNSKTGEKIEPKKIVTKYEEKTYFINGEEYSTRQGLADALEKFLGCSVDSYGDYVCGDREYFIFGYHGTGSCDARRCPEDGEIDLQDVMSSQSKYYDLAGKIRKVGLNPGKLKIFNCYSVS